MHRNLTSDVAVRTQRRRTCSRSRPFTVIKRRVVCLVRRITDEHCKKR